MKHINLKWFYLVLALSALLTLGACGKKATPPPPPPPPAAAGADSFYLGESQHDSGWPIRLAHLADQRCDGCFHRRDRRRAAQWVAKRVADRIDHLPPGRERLGRHAGSHRTAHCDPGFAPPPPPTTNVTDEQLFSQNVKDVYFDYDKADVRGDQQSSIQADAQFFSQHPEHEFHR